jgi:hypothetical protein
LCAIFIGLEKGARLIARKCHGEVPTTLCGGKWVSNISRSEAWYQGRWISVPASSYSCCPSRYPVTIYKPYLPVYLSLTVYFSLQVKNKQIDGIALPVFILGAGVVMNRPEL